MRRLGRTPLEIAAYAAAARAFEVVFLDVFANDSLDPRLIAICEAQARDTDAIVADALARHVPCTARVAHRRVSRLPRARARRARRVARVAGYAARTGDPDGSAGFCCRSRGGRS